MEERKLSIEEKRRRLTADERWRGIHEWQDGKGTRWYKARWYDASIQNVGAGKEVTGATEEDAVLKAFDAFDPRQPT